MYKRLTGKHNTQKQLKNAKFDNMKQYLHHRRELIKTRKYFLKQGDIIKLEEAYKIAQMIKDYGVVEVSACFEPRPNKHVLGLYHLEVVCIYCGYRTTIEVSKTGLIEYIIGNNDYVCKRCKEYNKKKKDEYNKKKKIESTGEIITSVKESKSEKNNYAIFFIEVFLDPKMTWDSSWTIKERWEKIHYYANKTNWDVVLKHILGMKYYEFLKTPYWKLMSQKKKIEAGYKCQLCNSAEYVSVHHRNYKYKGMEIYNMGELVVLCDNCHKKHHDIKN